MMGGERPNADTLLSDLTLSYPVRLLGIELANFRSVISVQIHSMSLESTLQTKPAWVDGSARQVKEGGRESGGRADGLM